MTDKPSDIILTITVSPLANSKRQVLVSGAPEKEMPVVRTGLFPELHGLIDQVWIELMKRKPQVVTVKVEKPKTTAAGEQGSRGAGETETETETTQSGDQSVAGAEPDAAPDPVTAAENAAGADVLPEAPAEPEQLPMIEGDPTSNLASQSPISTSEVSNE